MSYTLCTLKRILTLVLLTGCVSTSAPQVPAPQPIEKFFAGFSDEWMRTNPNLVASTRYFTGEELARYDGN